MATATFLGGAAVLYAKQAAPAAALYTVGAKALFSKVPYGVPNYTLAPKDDMYQSIAWRIGRPFTSKLFNIGPPVAIDGAPADGFNTKVAVSAVNPNLYAGTKDLSYARYPAEVLTLEMNMDLLRYAPARTTIYHALTEFNRVFGTKLPLEDFEDGPIATDGPTYATAKASSYWFIPGTKVSLGVLTISDRDTEISGLNWPTKTVAAQKAYFTKDTFRVEYNKLFGETWTQAQSTIADESAVSTGFGTLRDRQLSLTFNNGSGPVNRTVYFYRLDLGQLTNQGIGTSVWDLWAGNILDPANVQRLSAIMGIPFDEFELVNTPLVDDNPRGSIWITVEAKPNSKFFKGSTVIEITRAPHIADTIAPNTEFFF